MIWKLDAARLVSVGKMRDFEGVEEQSMAPLPNRSLVDAIFEECSPPATRNARQSVSPPRQPYAIAGSLEYVLRAFSRHPLVM